MKLFSRRDLREKLQKEHRRSGGLSSPVDEKKHPPITLWENRCRSSGWKWIPVILVFCGGLVFAFAVGMGIGYLWTTR